MGASAALRNVTPQPAGSTSEPNVPSVLAARSYASDCALVLLTYSVKRTVVPGLPVWRSTNATSGPAPAPAPPGSGALLVTSTVFAVIVVSTSVALAETSGLLAERAVFVTW